MNIGNEYVLASEDWINILQNLWIKDKKIFVFVIILIWFNWNDSKKILRTLFLTAVGEIRHEEIYIVIYWRDKTA